MGLGRWPVVAVDVDPLATAGRKAQVIEVVIERVSRRREIETPLLDEQVQGRVRRQREREIGQRVGHRLLALVAVADPRLLVAPIPSAILAGRSRGGRTPGGSARRAADFMLRALCARLRGRRGGFPGIRLAARLRSRLRRSCGPDRLRHQRKTPSAARTFPGRSAVCHFARPAITPDRDWPWEPWRRRSCPA